MDIFEQKTFSLNGDYAFSGLVFRKNKENIWNQFEGYEYFNDLIKRGVDQSIFIERMNQYTLEATHIFLSYSILFEYLGYATLGITFLCFLGKIFTIYLPILAILFFIAKYFTYRKGVREYRSLYDELFPFLVKGMYRSKTRIHLTFKDKMRNVLYFIILW
jgi:hypothetical protein